MPKEGADVVPPLLKKEPQPVWWMEDLRLHVAMRD
jgi:hypothetical protein